MVVPLVVEVVPVLVPLVIVPVEVPDVAGIVGVAPLYGIPSVTLSFEYSPDCMFCGIKNPPVSRTT